MGRSLFPDPETQNHKLHSTKRRWMLRQMYDRTYTRGLGGIRFRSRMTCFWNKGSGTEYECSVGVRRQTKCRERTECSMFSRLHRQPRCKYPCTNPQQTKLNQKNGKPNYAVATPHASATATPWRSHQNLGVCAPGKLNAKKSSSTAGCLSHRHASGPAALISE